MALSADAKYDTKDIYRSMPATIQSAATLYDFAFSSVKHEDASTTAQVGTMLGFASSNDHIPLGIAHTQGDSRTGNVDNTAVLGGPAEGRFNFERTAYLLTISSMAGNYRDRGRQIWCSADGTFSKTRASKNAFCGIVIEEYSTTQAWVLVAAGMDQVIIQKCVTRYVQPLGVITYGASGAVTWQDFSAPHHGAITDTWGSVIRPLAGATTGVSSSVQISIGGTDISGGVILWQVSNAMGTKVAGSSVTGTNIFHEDDLIDVVATNSNSGLTQGFASIFATVDVLLGN